MQRAVERGEPGHCYHGRAKGTRDLGKSRGWGLMERERLGDGVVPSPASPPGLIQNELLVGKGEDWEGRVDARRNGEES